MPESLFHTSHLPGDLRRPRAVYGVLLNFRGELAALGNAVSEPPYKAPPRAPVLYLKPANTWIAPGDPIPLPAGEAAIEPGVTLGLVFDRPAVRVPEQRALEYVAGCRIVNDVRLSHASYYRPAIKQLCRDGFCVIGAGTAVAADLDALTLRTYVNGKLTCEARTADLVRPVARLIADVTEFMTLAAGDILMIGVPAERPQAGEGDSVRVEVAGIGSIENPVVSEKQGIGSGSVGLKSDPQAGRPG